MKILLSTLLLAISLAVPTFVQAKETFRLVKGQEKSVSGRDLKIRFVAVTEDSRCPPRTQCIWAGNAKVTLALRSGGGKAETFEISSNTQPQSVDFAGYQIRFVDLSPKTTRRNVKPILTITAARLTR